VFGSILDWLSVSVVARKLVRKEPIRSQQAVVCTDSIASRDSAIASFHGKRPGDYTNGRDRVAAD